MFACLFMPPPVRGSGREPGPGSAGPLASGLADVARTLSPRIEVHADHLVTLDVAGLARLIGQGKAVAERLRRTAVERGCLPVRVAVAGTRTAAILLARGRVGITVVPSGHEASALAPLPIETLDVFLEGRAREPGARRVPGTKRRIGERRASGTGSVLSRWGVTTLGALAALPPAELSARLGQQGLWWQRLARGEDGGPLVPTLDEERFEGTLELEWPIEGLEPLSFVLGRLIEPLSQRLERRDRGAAGLHIRLRLVTHETHARSLQLPAPMRDPRVLRTLLLLDLESHPPPAGIDAVTVAIDPTPGRIVQESLLTRARPTPEQISTLMARLGALMGERRCGSPVLLDTHRPDASAIGPFQVSDDEPAPPVPGSRSPIPVVALRRFRLPVPASVMVDGGRPVDVRTDRQGLRGGRVHTWAGPWRTSGEWWMVQGGARAGGSAWRPGYPGWNRDEWDVALGDGGVYRIFEDQDLRRWFIEGMLD